jgi:hypothetical protein
MVSPKVLIAVTPRLSVTVTATEKLPETVGVPARTPALLRLRPGTVPISENVKTPTPPVAVIV